ncbi:MAG: hypothetical protein JXJ17_00930 [Anaerolineae bacterium]|nr:hypothetical protein [Anaerolineae bacterium]
MTKRTGFALALIMLALSALACSLMNPDSAADLSADDLVAEVEDSHGSLVSGSEDSEDTSNSGASLDPDVTEPTAEPTTKPTVEPTPEPTDVPEMGPLGRDDVLKPGFTAIYDCTIATDQLQPEGRGKSTDQERYTFTVEDSGDLMVVRENFGYGFVRDPELADPQNEHERKFEMVFAPHIWLPPEGQAVTIPASSYVAGDNPVFTWTFDGYEVFPAGEETLSALDIPVDTIFYAGEMAYSWSQDDGYNRIEQQYVRRMYFNYEANTGILVKVDVQDDLVACTTTDEDWVDLDCPGTGMMDHYTCELAGISTDLVDVMDASQ